MEVAILNSKQNRGNRKGRKFTRPNLYGRPTIHNPSGDKLEHPLAFKVSSPMAAAIARSCQQDNTKFSKMTRALWAWYLWAKDRDVSSFLHHGTPFEDNLILEAVEGMEWEEEG